MAHRRAFIKQLTAVAGIIGIERLSATDRALTAAIDALSPLSADREASVQLRERYLLSPSVTYFNHGSIGTIPRAVHRAHVTYLETCEANPWLYMWGGAWEEPREQVRAKAAGHLNCRPSEVAFTHNTTEGFNTLAYGLPLGPGDEVLFSSLNHPGASICWSHHAAQQGYTVRRFDFPILDVPGLSQQEILDAYDRHISPQTRVLVFPHVDNLIGLRHPVRELAALAKDRGVEIVAVDGAQTMGMLDVNLEELGADVYCASPHKWLQAPKGLGLMYVGEDLQTQLRPLWVTWGQDRWKGSARIFEDYGTRNLPALLSLGDAIDFQTQLGAVAKESRYRVLWESFRALASAAEHVIWRSPTEWSQAASLFALEIRNAASQTVFDHMYSKHGFVFRPFQTQGLNTVRISPNIYNSEAEITKFFELTAAL